MAQQEESDGGQRYPGEVSELLCGSSCSGGGRPGRAAGARTALGAGGCCVIPVEVRVRQSTAARAGCGEKLPGLGCG